METSNTQETPALFDSKGDVSEYYESLSRAARKAIWISRDHPKFTAAQLKSNELKEKRFQQETNLKAVQDMGGFRFLVFGRLTVCYRRAKNVLYLATTLRNAKDVDDPLSAKLGAAYRMVQSQYIVVPIHSKNNAKTAVSRLFFFAEFYDQ